MAAATAAALTQAARKLAALFFQSEALLVEINPLFVMADGGWVAADAKIVTDDNALARQPGLQQLLAAAPRPTPRPGSSRSMALTTSSSIPKGRSAC